MRKNDVLALISVADDFTKQNEKEVDVEQLKTACLINAMNSIAPGTMVDGAVQIQIDDHIYKIEDAYLQGYLPRKKYQSFCKKQKKEITEYKTTDTLIFNEIKELEGANKREWLLEKLSEFLKKQPYTTEEAIVKENENLKAELEKYKELYRKEKIKNKALRDRIQFSYLMNRENKKQSEKGKNDTETVDREQKINKGENSEIEKSSKEANAYKIQGNQGEKSTEQKEKYLSESWNAQEVQEEQEVNKENPKEEKRETGSVNSYNDVSEQQDEERNDTPKTQETTLSARYHSIKFTSEKIKGSFCFDAYVVNVKSWAGQLISRHVITIFPFFAEDLKKGICTSVVNGDNTNNFYAKFDATYMDVALGACMIRISLDIEKDNFKTMIIPVTSDSQYSIEVEETVNKRPSNSTELTGHLVLPYGDGINVVHILPIGGKNEETSGYANYIYAVEDGTKASGGEISNGTCPVITNGKDPQKLLCAWQGEVCVAQLGDPEYEYQ